MVDVVEVYVEVVEYRGRKIVRVRQIIDDRLLRKYYRQREASKGNELAEFDRDFGVVEKYGISDGVVLRQCWAMIHVWVTRQLREEKPNSGQGFRSTGRRLALGKKRKI
jgi:hypothetical protein